MSTYRIGNSHSARGTIARERGAMSWSKLPAKLRRGLTSAQAADAHISLEWHHASLYANRVHVYYIPQVEAFWQVIDTAGVTVEQVKDARRYQLCIDRDSADWPVRAALRAARDAAESIRSEIEESY